MGTTREVTKKDTLHNQLTIREVTKDNNTLHNQPTTREVTKRDMLHNQLTTMEVTKDNNMLHNQLTTREVTKRVMITEDTLHNQLITREVTNQTTEDTTNKNKLCFRSSLNEWGKNTKKIVL